MPARETLAPEAPGRVAALPSRNLRVLAGQPNFRTLPAGLLSYFALRSRSSHEIRCRLRPSTSAISRVASPASCATAIAATNSFRACSS
jgi:hypothetical protein